MILSIINKHMQISIKKKRISTRKIHFQDLYNKIDNLDLLIIIKKIIINFNLDSNKKMSLINNHFLIINYINLFLVNLIQMLILINNNKFTINTINNQILNINLISFNRYCRKHVNHFNLSSR